MALLRPSQDHAQKKTAHATEQDRPDILKRREAWFDGQIELDPERLVFIDETWASTNMARRYGRAPRGQRLRVGIPYGHWKTTTFVAGLRTSGIIAPFVLDGPINRDAFETYLVKVLVPELRPGDIVIMDNLSSHKGPNVRAITEAGRRASPLPAALQSRLQSHRERLRQAQGAPAQGRPANRRWPLERHRTDRRSLHPRECANYFAAGGYDAT